MSPIYMAGRFLTASRPSSTWILLALYCSSLSLSSSDISEYVYIFLAFSAYKVTQKTSNIKEENISQKRRELRLTGLGGRKCRCRKNFSRLPLSERCDVRGRLNSIVCATLPYVLQRYCRSPPTRLWQMRRWPVICRAQTDGAIREL